jgi:hypothetical protein
MKVRAQLANYDVAGSYEFTAEFLYAPALPCAVAAISGTSARFFMCHCFSPKTESLQYSEIVPILADIFYANSRVSLSVSLSFAVIFAAFVLEDNDFGQPPLPDYSGLNLYAFHKRLANPQLIPVGEEQHLIEGYVFPDLAGNLFYFDYMPGPGFILPPTGPENGVHRFKSSWTATGYAFQYKTSG